MSEFHIRDEEQARFIVSAFEHCRNCSECPLDTPEGWYCSYLYERAQQYLDRHADTHATRKADAHSAAGARPATP